MADQPLVLVVDDEASFREIFSTALSADGYRVETAENGQMGIDKARILKPNLILMDVNMPVMDGPSAVLKLGEDPQTKDIKVAFLTNLGDPHEEMRKINEKFSQDFGASAYLKKTDNLSTLSAKVKELLQ